MQEADPSYVAIQEALRTPNDDDRFTREEVIIRDSFATLLYAIERLERFLKANLFSEEEIFPYLGPGEEALDEPVPHVAA